MILISQQFSLDLLRTFVVVSQTRNFTRAAEQLNCVQSAVSTQIRKLEDSLQVRLLERTRRQVNLTDEGRTLLQYAQRILRLKEEVLAEIAVQGITGRVRVGVSDTSMCYLPLVLKAFAQRHPMIDVEMQCSRSWDALDALEAGQVDVAFVTQKCGRQGGAKVSQTPLVWALSAQSTVDELDPVPLAIFAPGCIYRMAAIAALEKAGKSYRLAYESPSRAGLECAVTAGLAVTIIPQDRVDESLRVLTHAGDGFPVLPVFRTYLFGARGQKSPPIKAFQDIVIQTVANQNNLAEIE
jgi:DNA-binding transcriptional LysR family regulator